MGFYLKRLLLIHLFVEEMFIYEFDYLVIKMGIKQDLTDNPIILAQLEEAYYKESILEVMGHLKDKRVCYVTLNKEADTLKKQFHLKGIPTNNLFFIDAVSKALKGIEEKENMILVSSPAGLNEINEAVSEVLESGYFDVLIFDSLSTLELYDLEYFGKERFILNLITRVRAHNQNLILTYFNENFDINLINNLNVDKRINFKGLYNKLERKKHTMAIGSIAVIAILTGVAFFTNTQTQVTGMVTLENSPSPLGISLIFISLIILIFFIYRNPQFNPVKSEVLKGITPRIDGMYAKGKLANRVPNIVFKNKIYSWYHNR